MQIQKSASYAAFTLAVLGTLAYLAMFFSINQEFRAWSGIFALAILIIGALPFAIGMVLDLFKGKLGVDIIALAAIITAMILKEYLPGLVILVMLSGGDSLEQYAMQRARKELTALLSKASDIAHLKEGNEIKDISTKELKPGSVVLVKSGETVPADGIVIKGGSAVDQSAITGESLPIDAESGVQVLSGSVNLGNPLEIRVIRESKDSKYAQIISLVKHAEESKAPIVRLADKYTLLFTIVTFILASLAWLISHDSIRLLAVLVVATPCPLILATPIAVISGISRAAKRGAIIKDGGALEQLGQAKAFVFDKTGTLTLGRPEVFEISVLRSGETKENVLKISASLDQLSLHILARSLTNHAKSKGVVLEYPEDYSEKFGEGVSGKISALGTFYFGKLSYLTENGINIDAKIKEAHVKRKGSGISAAYLADSQGLIAAVFFEDIIRPETERVFGSLRNLGVKKIVMLTGDKREVAENIAKILKLKEVIAECLPEQKVEKIKDLQQDGMRPVAMVGDGVNDAPSLATADVGIAMGAHGGSASSEAGDVVIAVDDLSRVTDAYQISRHAIFIAKQGIWIGIGLSIFLMILAALGFIPPITGAILQECVDVLVIFNALRVLRYKIDSGQVHHY